jgi:hypothetical protein
LACLTTGPDAVWHVLRPETLSRAEAEQVVNRFFGKKELPGRMPEGCNFYGLLETVDEAELVAQMFASAGWRVKQAPGMHLLEVQWARLTLEAGRPMVVMGWIDEPDQRVSEIQGLLGRPGMKLISQWVNVQGRLWRDMPFDPAMLDPDDARLPADIKESIRQNNLGKDAGASPALESRKPWRKFW